MKWTIDPENSTIEFVVSHLGISTIRGGFRQLQGTIDVTEDGEIKAVQASVVAGSLDTSAPERDDRLRSAAFLDAAHFPTLSFKSTTVEACGPGQYRVHGEIAIRGEVRHTVFDVEADPVIVDPKGRQRTGATVVGTFSRKEWGLAWDQIVPFARFLVGDEVRVVLDIEVIGPAASPPLASATPQASATRS